MELPHEKVDKNTTLISSDSLVRGWQRRMFLKVGGN